jgi:hypothetical protein
MKTLTPPGLLILATTIAGGAGGASAAPADAWISPPKVPAALAVPATAKVTAHFHAVGAQVYACVAAPGTTHFAWTLQRPDAALFDQKGAPAGTHGAGPSWTAKDGSTVAAKKVAQADAPTADAVPWLLLRADNTSGDGVFSKVVYVQRVETKKGKPPATKCDASTANAEARADYSADYYFYN